MCLTCREAWRTPLGPVRCCRLVWQGAAATISSPSTAPPACAPFGGRAVGRLRGCAAPCQTRRPVFRPGPTCHTSVAICYGKESLPPTETRRKAGSPNRRIAGERGSFFPSAVARVSSAELVLSPVGAEATERERDFGRQVLEITSQLQGQEKASRYIEMHRLAHIDGTLTAQRLAG
jgi:hypothetical protein